jgi:V8-like Glu-specific endopeptidase
MYDRYYSFGKKAPFFLPERWANPPSDFKMSTPMNFSSTNDIIGGNSGSSVVNKNLEVVGLIFDSNIEGLAGNSIFDTEKNRAVSVHSAGIVEGLDKIYRATRIASELRNKRIQ